MFDINERVTLVSTGRTYRIFYRETVEGVTFYYLIPQRDGRDFGATLRRRECAIAKLAD